mgnify:CR=1 FL=1
MLAAIVKVSGDTGVRTNISVRKSVVSRAISLTIVEIIANRPTMKMTVILMLLVRIVELIAVAHKERPNITRSMIVPRIELAHLI